MLKPAATRLILRSVVLALAASSLCLPTANAAPSTGPTNQPVEPLQVLPPGSTLPLSEGEVSIVRDGRAHAARAIETVRLADGREAVAGRIIVGFRAGAGPESRQEVHGRVAATGVTALHSAEPIGPDAQVVNVARESVPDAIAAYLQDDRVEYVEPDVILHLTEIPNDFSFGLQWGMTRIQAPGAPPSASASALRAPRCPLRPT